METGTKISIGLHGIVLGLVAFGGPLFDSDDSQAIQISEVSIITSADFDALISRSPIPQNQEPEQQAQPELETASVEAPAAEEPPQESETPVVETAPAADSEPDVSAISEVQQPEIDVESPELSDQANDSVGTTLVVPDSQQSQEVQDGQREPDQMALLRPKPRPAPRVDNKTAPKPPTDAETAEDVETTTAPDSSATEQLDESTEKAPLESATEIVTEAEQQEDTAAPVKKRRCCAVAKEKARKEAEAKAIAEALAAATSDTTPTQEAPSGPPLTGSEKNALVLAVQQCWNVPVGVQNASDLVVVLAVELTLDGKLVGNPKLIDPPGTPQGVVRQAYEAGRRALLRCAPYAMPREKYEQWRHLEVVFNPQKMVVK